jgi:hypothetical protein
VGTDGLTWGDMMAQLAGIIPIELHARAVRVADLSPVVGFLVGWGAYTFIHAKGGS